MALVLVLAVLVAVLAREIAVPVLRFGIMGAVGPLSDPKPVSASEGEAHSLTLGSSGPAPSRPYTRS